MSYRTRRADLFNDDDVDHLRDLHTLTFGDTAPLAEFNYGQWWLVYAVGEPDPVAFAGMVPSVWARGHGYLKRTGVLHKHLGHGLQRRLIGVRERCAIAYGFHTILTDTTDNPQSANNLARCGYKMFDPPKPWGLKNTLYWRKPLTR